MLRSRSANRAFFHAPSVDMTPSTWRIPWQTTSLAFTAAPAAATARSAFIVSAPRRVARYAADGFTCGLSVPVPGLPSAPPRPRTSCWCSWPVVTAAAPCCLANSKSLRMSGASLSGASEIELGLSADPAEVEVEVEVEAVVEVKVVVEVVAVVEVVVEVAEVEPPAAHPTTSCDGAS